MSSDRGRGAKECELTRWFCDELKKVNALTIAVVGSAYQRSGLPDRYLCHRRWRGWVEFKRNDHPVEPKQRLWLQGLLDRGDRVLIGRFHPENDFLAFERVPPPGCGEGEELYRVDLREARVARTPGVVLLEALERAWARYAATLTPCALTDAPDGS